MPGFVVASRFSGPPGTANGGYAAGLLAGHLEGAARVRLEAPIPLDTPLVVSRADDGTAELHRDGNVIARASAATVDLDVPEAPSPAEAAEASGRSVAHADHFYPHCFVCGTARDASDGLRIFAGPTTDDGAVVAATWRPDPRLDAGDGHVAREFLWAALDCPGYFAAQHDNRPMLLGQMTARFDRPVAVGETTVVIGWRTAEASGRKHEVGTALFDGSGALCGVAHGIWIEPR